MSSDCKLLLVMFAVLIGFGAGQVMRLIPLRLDLPESMSVPALFFGVLFGAMAVKAYKP